MVYKQKCNPQFGKIRENKYDHRDSSSKIDARSELVRVAVLDYGPSPIRTPGEGTSFLARITVKTNEARRVENTLARSDSEARKRGEVSLDKKKKKK